MAPCKIQQPKARQHRKPEKALRGALLEPQLPVIV